MPLERLECFISFRVKPRTLAGLVDVGSIVGLPTSSRVVGQVDTAADCVNTNESLDTTCVRTVMLGTNDAKWCNWYGEPNGLPSGNGTQFGEDYVSMIRLFKALPSKPKVYVVLPPPAVSQCPATGPAGNASICLAYNMSFHAINEIYPSLQVSMHTCPRMHVSTCERTH